MVQDWSRDSFPPRHQSFSHPCFPQNQHQRHSSFSADRSCHDLQSHNTFAQDRCQPTVTTARFPATHDAPTRQPIIDIDEALRRHCGIPARRYFVVAAADDGTPSSFLTGHHKLPDSVIRQFFDAAKFRHIMNKLDAGIDLVLDDSLAQDDALFNRPVFHRSRHPDRRRSSAFGEWENSARSARKRPRPRNPLNDEDDMPMAVSSRRGIKIGDSDAVWNFYQQRFRNCQQTACKLIAKAWVKAVEPKKQSTHPYTGKDEKAPDWWPKPWGPTKDDKVRHKEPDHLYKRERVHLLAHILRIVLEPNSKQHHDIRKLGLNVAKLEETTAEALSSFFMDNDANARKKPYLTEIFKVARQEERYKNGEIDGTTEIYVMAEDKVPESYVSENDDTPSLIKEDEDADPTPKPNTTIRTDAATLASLAADPFGELPMRGSHFQPPLMADLSTQHGFVDGGGIQVHAQTAVSSTTSNLTLDLVPSPHETSRRPSVFSDFPSPGSNNIYHQQWQQPSSNGTTGSPMYAYSTQQQNLDTAHFASSGVGMDPSQSFMTASFSEAPRTAYNEQQTGSIFSTDDLTGGGTAQTNGYDYVTNNHNRVMMSQAVDSVGRTSMHQVHS